MKKSIIVSLIVFMVGFLSAQRTQAQGTIYLSNLGQMSTGIRLVGSNSWFAAEFETGNNPGGFTLNSIQLAMTNDVGNPSGFTVMIYNGVGVPTGADIFRPGSSLGILDGSANPSTAGIYTYTEDSNLLLSPGTDYFVVLTAGTFFLLMLTNGASQAQIPIIQMVAFSKSAFMLQLMVHLGIQGQALILNLP